MTTAPRANELRYLDPHVVARMGSMELRARTVVEGFLIGLHRSPYKGFSVEFSEYRQYMPGDDVSLLDWKVYARSDRYYVKNSKKRPISSVIYSSTCPGRWDTARPGSANRSTGRIWQRRWPT